ncbi:hypothetical protein G7085_16570 [Tessaracoccus sp. HDW20]|uniref:hypothetical protein n=1 Tax=Tessaracoccus coleopterorum TaxID=2714950 RepID=UPI0018D2CF53|nr:hypothetical protein [Tessaracoccus coleopterorum]NHB85664.1 hypothetical protein [Tessaracoccus coleopterorum]
MGEPRGSSVALSVLLRPRPDFPQWGWLSILAGMAVSAALADLAPDPSRVTLKWPNDVLIGGQRSVGSSPSASSDPTGRGPSSGWGSTWP